MQQQFDFHRLVLGLDDALLQVEPVVGADGDAQEAEAADGEHAAEQGQRLPAAGAHSQMHKGPRLERGRLLGEGMQPSARSRLQLFGGTDVSKLCPLPLIAYIGRAEISKPLKQSQRALTDGDFEPNPTRLLPRASLGLVDVPGAGVGSARDGLAGSSSSAPVLFAAGEFLLTSQSWQASPRGCSRTAASAILRALPDAPRTPC